MFADDSKIYNKSFNHDIVQMDINNMLKWSSKWCLYFNTNKCNVLHNGEKNTDWEQRMQPARGRFARFNLDRQMASTLPAHWKMGPAPVFGASQPLEPAEWLALLILKAGDIESNPGPQNRKPPPPP